VPEGILGVFPLAFCWPFDLYLRLVVLTLLLYKAIR
jgi:hypothetical protein